MHTPPMTFIVRIATSGGGFRAVVERVSTGRKEQVHTAEGIARAIAAMAFGEERDMTLNGKHALVTGASRGIGRGIALKLAESGARIAVHYYTNEAAANETLERVRKHGSDGFLVQADLSRVDDVQRMFAEVGQRFGALDVFVANGRPELAKFYQKPLEISLEAWDQAVDSQAKAFLVAVQKAAPLMGAGGRIVAVTYAPGATRGTWQPWIAMGSAKAAMESLVRYFAVALAPRGITVNSISPGLTDDSVFNGLPSEVQDIGNAVAMLCSPASSWITGQLIYADGGASLVDTLMPLEIQRG